MIFNTLKFLSITFSFTLLVGTTSLAFADESSNSSILGDSTNDFEIVSNASGVITSCTNLPIARTLDPFYTKCSIDSGMVVASSNVVPDEALLEMNRIIIQMTKDHPEIIGHLNQHGIIAGVIGVNQVTTDMPEHSDLNVVFPGGNWDATRGVGATIERPLVSAAEENLLCYLSDPFLNGQTFGESIAIHEFSHSLFEYGLVSSSDSISPGFPPPTSYWPGGSALFTQLQSIHQNATNQGRWLGTYGGSNWTEFFAVGSQVYFDASDRTFEYDFTLTREGLEIYEPNLASFLATIYPADWRYSCPLGSPVYDCKPPPFGQDWNITSSCTMKQDVVPFGNVFVKNNSVLTISNGTTLYVGLEYSKLTIESGSGVLIKAGGAIT